MIFPDDAGSDEAMVRANNEQEQDEVTPRAAYGKMARPASWAEPHPMEAPMG
jgi:hypothetical protein